MKASLDQYPQNLPTAEGKYFIELFKNENITVEVYKPYKVNFQTPHSQDDIYSNIWIRNV